MLFDPSEVLYTIENSGQPFVAERKATGETLENGDPKTEDIPLTLGVAICRALQVPDDKTTAEERIRRTKLAFDIIEALDAKALVDWSADQIVETKKLCLALWTHPVVYYRIDAALEGTSDASANGSVAEEIEKITAGPVVENPEG